MALTWDTLVAWGIEANVDPSLPVRVSVHGPGVENVETEAEGDVVEARIVDGVVHLYATRKTPGLQA